MLIVKKINNNVALAKDGDGREMVVFGRGVGYPPIPYELTDMSEIRRTFYDIKENYIVLADELPEAVIMLASDIVELARIELECELNPNLPFTLADHLNFTFDRLKNGVVLHTPLAYDIEHFYPTEVELGRQALKIVQERMGIEMPDCEAINIALHLVNAEMENNDMHSTLMETKIICDVTVIVEEALNIKLETNTFNYSRFVLHLRYLVQRLEKNMQENNGMSSLFWQTATEHPGVFDCTRRVAKYFESTWGWKCNPDEMLYLFMHINRVKEHSEK